jgi:hypothetical protein
MHPGERPFSFVARVAAIVVTVVAVTACGGAGVSPSGPSAASSGGPAAASVTGADAPFIPQLISSETIVGANRFLFGIEDAAGQKSIGAPAIQVQVGFQSDDGQTTIPASPATFIWAIPDERGIYSVDATFPSAGSWKAAFRAAGASWPADATVSVGFDVQAKGHAIPIGGNAPSTPTPTAATPADIARIATDPTPDPSFYATSEDQALANHQPFVLVFATPKFCVSKQCGPTLDGIKAVAKTEAPGVVFINAEPYKLEYANGSLQPLLDGSGQLQATVVTNAWGILSEPWVFVVDGNGIVKASFEAVVGADELKAAIAAAR